MDCKPEHNTPDVGIALKNAPGASIGVLVNGACLKIRHDPNPSIYVLALDSLGDTAIDTNDEFAYAIEA